MEEDHQNEPLSPIESNTDQNFTDEDFTETSAPGRGISNMPLKLAMRRMRSGDKIRYSPYTQQIKGSSTLTSPKKVYHSYTQPNNWIETQSQKKTMDDGKLGVSYIPEGSTKNISNINTVKEKQYRCEWCRLRYLSQEELNMHIKTEHTYEIYSIE